MKPPTAWLWEEIERRFGAAVAIDLREGFNAQMKEYQRLQRLETYRKDIPRLQARVQLALSRGESEAMIRNLERKIAYREKMLRDE